MSHTSVGHVRPESTSPPAAALAAARRGETSEVETLLGDASASQLRAVLDAALSAQRWETVAYIADRLADQAGPPTDGGGESLSDSGGDSCDGAGGDSDGDDYGEHTGPARASLQTPVTGAGVDYPALASELRPTQAENRGAEPVGIMAAVQKVSVEGGAVPPVITVSATAPTALTVAPAALTVALAAPTTAPAAPTAAPATPAAPAASPRPQAIAAASETPFTLADAVVAVVEGGGAAKTAKKERTVCVAEFEFIDPKAKEGEYGSKEQPSIYYHLDGRANVGKLQNPDEVVIRKGEISVAFDYPLAERVMFALKAPGGADHFTRKTLAQAIARRYAWIYKKEESGSAVRPGPHPQIPCNRNRTNGPFGIWGHALSDLDLHTVYYHPRRGFYGLGIDS